MPFSVPIPVSNQRTRPPTETVTCTCNHSCRICTWPLPAVTGSRGRGRKEHVHPSMSTVADATPLCNFQLWSSRSLSAMHGMLVRVACCHSVHPCTEQPSIRQLLSHLGDQWNSSVHTNRSSLFGCQMSAGVQSRVRMRSGAALTSGMLQNR